MKAKTSSESGRTENSGSESAADSETVESGLETETEQTEKEGYEIPDTLEVTFQGPESELLISARVEGNVRDAREGEVKLKKISQEAAKKLYGEDASLWVQDPETPDWITYGEEPVYLTCEDYTINFEDKHDMQETHLPGSGEKLSSQEREKLVQKAEKILKGLEIEAEIVDESIYDISGVPYLYLSLQGRLSGTRIVGRDSSVPVGGSMQITKGGLIDLYFGFNLEAGESEKSRLMSFSEMMEMVKGYVEDGFICQSDEECAVSRISLEYYVAVDEKEQLTFFPVWNFSFPNLLIEDQETQIEYDRFYIDARNGTLVEYFL